MGFSGVSQLTIDRRLEIVKYINDPVYGSIGLTSMEVDLINTPVFQRLRGLRQLARVDYVFPGAEHSRFVHSLGVLYVMGLMTEHLLHHNMINEEDAVKMRVAALLHDIGHFPLSHLGETVYGYFEDSSYSSKIISTEENAEKNTIPLYQLSSFQSKSADHERLGKYIVENNSSIRETLISNDLNPSEIGDIFTGKFGAINMVYTQLLHSSLDADRLDYLLRDSFQTGVKYGLVDLEYLIRLLMVIDTPYEMKEKELGGSEKMLVCDKKGQHVIDHFLMSRFFHYSQVVNHKTNASFEGLIKCMYIKLVDSGKYMFNNLNEIRENVNTDRFLSFNDASLEVAFKEYNDITQDEEYKMLYRMYRRRYRPKTLIDLKCFDKNDAHSDEVTVLKRLLKKEPEKISEIIGSNHWGYQVKSISVEKIHSRSTTKESREARGEDYGEAIKLYDRRSHEVSYLAENPLSVINKLADYNSQFVRIFILDDEEHDCEKMQDLIYELL